MIDFRISRLMQKCAAFFKSPRFAMLMVALVATGVAIAQTSDINVTKGIAIGYKRGFTPEIHAGNVVEGNVKQTSAYQDADLSKRYAFPIDGDIVVTSGYGNRSKPNAKASSNHQALDIKAQGFRQYQEAVPCVLRMVVRQGRREH